MKRNTKKEIVITAKTLFNERGYNNVSTKDIADALGISKGNLTYHFKKKEDIMEAILEEGQSRKRPDAPASIRELNDYFLDQQQVVRENAFYFWHYAQLSQLSEEIRGQQGQAYQSHIERLTKAFQALEINGFLRPEEFAGEFRAVIDMLFISSVYWMPFCNIRQADKTQKEYPDHAWLLLYHLLTQAGREELLRLRVLKTKTR